MEALNMSLPATMMSLLHANFSFYCQTKGISYLGVTIPSNLSDLYCKATIIESILEWFPRLFTKASIMVEQDLAPVDLLIFLWFIVETFTVYTLLPC